MKKRILTRSRLPKIALGGGLLLLAAVAAVFAVNLSRSRPAWYVEPGLERQWGELLERASAPPPFTLRNLYDPAAGLKKGRYGVIIATTFPEEEGPSSEEEPRDAPIRLFPGLYRDRGDYQGAIPLALNPWLVFRKTTDPPLALDRALSGRDGDGFLILPGAEDEAVLAWTAQLLQSSPGAFPMERQVWEDTAQRLIYANSGFQAGAPTYTWLDGWIRLLQNETAWLYAPLSRARGLDPYDVGRLSATIFPIPGDWNTYGLQAEVLWAVPRAGENRDQAALLEEAGAWLSAVETQTLIADLLGWIPAQPGGTPYDTLARQAQVAWFSSGFVWQISPKGGAP